MGRISERQLEDWIVEHWDDVPFTGDYIGRQIELPHGRLDLLGFLDVAQVIELKARPLKEKDIGQLLRYTGDIKATLQMAYDCNDKDRLRSLLQTEYQWELVNDILQLLASKPTARAGFERSIAPILIGSSVTESILACAYGANIEVYTWKHYEGYGFEFYHHTRGIDFYDAVMAWWADHVTGCMWLSEFTNIYWDRACDGMFTAEGALMNKLFGTDCIVRTEAQRKIRDGQ